MNHIKLILKILVVGLVLTAFVPNSAVYLRGQFFTAFSSGSTEMIDAAIAACERAGDPLASAYKGALLMKKADLIKGPGEKLKMFKEGHELLEKQIAAKSNDAELRFIRLCVQENAPKIVKYSGQIEEDKAVVVEKFASLPSDVRNFVRDYAKTSEVLTSDELI